MIFYNKNGLLSITNFFPVILQEKNILNNSFQYVLFLMLVRFNLMIINESFFSFFI